MPLTPNLTQFTTGSPVIASFSTQDIISGYSILSLFGCQESDSTGDGYFLTTNSLYSNEIATAVTIVSTSSEVMNIDFDTVLGAHRRIVDDVFVNVPLKISGNADAKTATVVATLIDYDGSIEKIIGSAVTMEALSTSTTSETVTKMLLSVIPITTEYRVKKGNTLRLNLTITSAATNGNNTTTLGHDPQGRSELDSITPTKLNIQIPVE